MTGKTISHYKILEKLGGGGMGVVYKAEDTKLHRIVALKFLPPELTRDEEAKKRFIHEAEAASSLDHNNICAIHEIDETEEEQLFICMNYYEGETLKKKIERGPLKIEDAVDIEIQMCRGLQKAHEKGIVHRDIKPANIFITDDKTVKILDFGLAKLTGYSILTKVGETLGTTAYMSPEQTSGKEVDRRTDIWSLGVVLYEMITGRTPFQGEYNNAVSYNILNEEPEPPTALRTGVPMELERIILKALNKNPFERYQHTDELFVDLNKCSAGVSQTKITVKNKKSQNKSYLVTGILAVIIMSAILWFLFLDKQGITENGKSIAVLPFVDMSPQKDQEYLCDGMTEDLINRLSNLGGLKVPARTSVYTFKGKDFDIKEAGSKLSVETILEGSVQKSGDRLRITAQLINVSDGYHLWSEKYDRELKDVFTIQDEISSAIVNALKLKLSPGEIKKISEHPIDNVKAYEYYRKALSHVMRFDAKDLDSAIVYLKTASDIIGDNVLLFAAMSAVYSQYVNIGIKQEDYLVKAEEYSRKALSLQPDHAPSLCDLAFLSIYKEYPQNWQNYYFYFKKALASDTNEARAYMGLANFYQQTGQTEKAYPLLIKLEDKDPLNPTLYIRMGYYYIDNCEFAKAEKQFRMLYQFDPTSLLAQTSYAISLVFNKKYDQALNIIDKMDKTDTKNVMVLFSLLVKYGLLGDSRNALNLITPDFRKTCLRDFEWSYWVANGLSIAGAKEEAIDWLENAVKRGFLNYPLMQCNPCLDNIRNEPRFKKLMEYAKFEWENFKVPE